MADESRAVVRPYFSSSGSISFLLEGEMLERTRFWLAVSLNSPSWIFAISLSPVFMG